MTKQQKVEITIPDYLNPDEREAVGAEIIQRIIERTQNENKDAKGRSFAKYSDSYVDSVDFKAAGKRRSNINLTLSGEMLEELKLLKTRKGKIEIGYDKGDSINGKVEGNRLGTYGKSSQVGPKRDFLGITQQELRQIIKNYPRGKINDDIRQQRIDELLAGEIVSQEVLKKIDLEE